MEAPCANDDPGASPAAAMLAARRMPGYLMSCPLMSALARPDDHRPAGIDDVVMHAATRWRDILDDAAHAEAARFPHSAEAALSPADRQFALCVVPVEPHVRGAALLISIGQPIIFVEAG